MKILYSWFKKDSNSARKHIEKGIITGFGKNGHQVATWEGDPAGLEILLEKFQPDVFYGYTRNAPNYGASSWIFNGCFELLNNYRKETGMKVVLEAHPDMKKLFTWAKIPMDLVNYNRGFYDQPAHGTPAEIKLTENNFVDIITHIWNTESSNQGFEWWKNHGVFVKSFPLAFDTGEYLDRDMVKDIDISFIGGWWPYKALQLDKFIKPIDEEFGNKLVVYGTGWPYKSKGYADDAVVNRVFNRSKINLCLHEPGLVQSTPLHVSERIFKVSGIGGLAISDHNECIKEYFKTGEYVMASTPKEMIELCHYYLEHPEQAQTIAKAAQSRVLHDHTYKKRTRDLLEDL